MGIPTVLDSVESQKYPTRVARTIQFSDGGLGRLSTKCIAIFRRPYHQSRLVPLYCSAQDLVTIASTCLFYSSSFNCLPWTLRV
jgi:hypothetical protein